MRIAFVAPLFLFGVGCFQYDQEVVVYPDGSGKIVRTLAVKRATLNLIRTLTKGKQGQDPLKDFGKPEALQEQSEGIVAWSRPERSSRIGWDSVRVTGYFEDIGKVRIYRVKTEGDLVERTVEFAGTPGKDGADRVLAIDSSSRDAINLDTPGLKGLLPFLAEARLRTSITVSGKIKAAAGFGKVEERTATFELDHPTLRAAVNDPKGEASRELERLLDERPLVRWRGRAVDRKELTEFRKEFREAKAEWKRLAPKDAPTSP